MVVLTIAVFHELCFWKSYQMGRRIHHLGSLVDSVSMGTGLVIITLVLIQHILSHKDQLNLLKYETNVWIQNEVWLIFIQCVFSFYFRSISRTLDCATHNSVTSCRICMNNHSTVQNTKLFRSGKLNFWCQDLDRSFSISRWYTS